MSIDGILLLALTISASRIERAGLLAALRTHGLVSFEQAECIVLETTGVSSLSPCQPQKVDRSSPPSQTFSVIPKLSMLNQPDATVLLCEGVPGYQEELEKWDKEGNVSDLTLSPA
jgi:hypothetical protein